MTRRALVAVVLAVLALIYLSDLLRTARRNVGALSADLVTLCEHSDAPRCQKYRAEYWQ